MTPRVSNGDSIGVKPVVEGATMLHSSLYSWPPAEGHPISAAWKTGIPLRDELPASVFGLCTTAVYQAEICPLGTPGLVMTFLWLPDQQLVLNSGWASIP
jgi:hypothetical protein